MTDTADPSSLSEDRLEILKLVENQTITADEASRLLEALERSDRTRHQATEPFQFAFDPPQASGRRGAKRSRIARRNIRIRISDTASGEAKLNLVLPGTLLSTGLTMVRRFAPNFMIEDDALQESIDTGSDGVLLDIVDGGQRVEIFIEER
ncbi:MAG: hypothetical protein WKF81_01290 [Thermomicrobiales bacterium]